MKAQLLLKNKYVYPDSAIVEMRIWRVPQHQRTPDGIKYSLVYIDKNGRRLLGYDNAEGKGHHKHWKDKETSVDFESIEALCAQFLDEVKKIRRETHEN